MPNRRRKEFECALGCHTYHWEPLTIGEFKQLYPDLYAERGKTFARMYDDDPEWYVLRHICSNCRQLDWVSTIFVYPRKGQAEAECKQLNKQK